MTSEVSNTSTTVSSKIKYKINTPLSHNLQIIKKETNYFINSGSPDKPGYTVGDNDALYSESVSGLIELIYYDNGKVATNVHILDKTEVLQTDEKFVLYQNEPNPFSKNTNIPPRQPPS